jgi:hypothetical protein
VKRLAARGAPLVGHGRLMPVDGIWGKKPTTQECDYDCESQAAGPGRVTEWDTAAVES